MTRNLKLFCLMICAILTVGAINAQEGLKVRGRVVNESGEPIEGAVVTCIELPDSIVTVWAITDKNGAYLFEKYPEDRLRTMLEVSILGYEKTRVSPVPNGETVVTLREAAFALREVAITASASSLKRKPGKFIYTPPIADLKGLDSYELLRYTPLTILEGNTISILGKGKSTIYINGRKPVMDNASLMEMLRSTPAEQIDKIEIISTPNSSHKASTTGGIVNVVLKKNPSQGLTGSASASAGYRGERVSPAASLYLGYSGGKFNASANFSYSRYSLLDRTDTYYNYQNTQTDIVNSATATGTNTSIYGNFSATYDFTSKSTLGASLHIGGSDGENSSTTNSHTKSAAGNRYSSSTSETNTPFERPEMGAVVYYNQKTDGRGSNLDLSANYSTSYNSSLGNMEYREGELIDRLVPYSTFLQNSLTDSYGYEFKGRYRHVFADEGSLEGGYELNSSHISNNFDRRDFDGQQYVYNSAYSNHFVYNEQINALYVNYDKMWGDVLNTTLGLRVEHTHVKGEQKHTGETFTHNYLNWFPQLGINFDLADGDHNLDFSFSRGIVRPFYNNLNPFKIWLSENTYSMGNPSLDPEIYTDVDITYMLLGDYIFGISYSYGSDAFSEYTLDTDGNTTVSSIANFGSEHNLSFYFNLNKMLFNGAWRLMFNAGADYSVVDGSVDDRDAGYKCWRGSAGLRNLFRISKSKGITGTLSYSYDTPVHAIFRTGKHKHLLGVSLNKQFNFGGTLSLDAFNLLDYTPNYRYHSSTYSYRADSRISNVYVLLKYSQRFGKSRVKGAKDRSKTKLLERFKK